MRFISSIFLLIIVTQFAFSADYTERIESSIQLLSSDVDSSYSIAKDILSEASRDGDDYGIVKANFILGYIQHLKKGDFGKAIIYYLEAIRYGEESGDPRFDQDLITIYKNCGVIFKKFKSYELASEYYEYGLEAAERTNNVKEVISLQYNLSGVYREQGDFDRAVGTLLGALDISEKGSKKYFDILNRLSNTFLKMGDLEQTKEYSRRLIAEKKVGSKKLIAYSYHLLGKVSLLENKLDEAEEYLLNSLLITEQSPEDFPGKKAKFELLVDLSSRSQLLGDSREAVSYLESAETLMSSITQEPEYFKIYLTQANLLYSMGDYKTSKHYNDLHSQSLSDYLELQAELQESEQRFNMDLITKRYFAEVEKQDRIAEIMFASKLTSGSLLFLLLVVIGYHRYQKVALRKSIERELVSLKILD